MRVHIKNPSAEIGGGIFVWCQILKVLALFFKPHKIRLCAVSLVGVKSSSPFRTYNRAFTDTCHRLNLLIGLTLT